MNEEPKAKVFISCGQSSSEERSIAKKVARIIEKAKFETYIAVQEQSLTGIVDNIFHNQLKKSEYFLFIDFKREKLAGDDGKDIGFRGSLFSHQELAVAAFLGFGKRFMGFIQEGIKPIDGVLGQLQGNCEKFSSEKELLSKVRKAFSKRSKGVNGKLKCGWRPDWKNQLRIIVPGNIYPFCSNFKEHRNAYYLRIENQNAFESAKNCYAFMKSIKVKGKHNYSRLPQIELKWENWDFPNAIIPPKFSKSFCALKLVRQDRTNNRRGYDIQLIPFGTLGVDAKLGLNGINRIEPERLILDMDFEVISDNFQTCSVSLEFELYAQLERCTAKLINFPSSIINMCDNLETKIPQTKA